MQPTRNRRALLSWILYDGASNAFPLVMISAVYVLYFKQVVVGAEDPGRGDALWGAALSVSALVVALSAPFMGTLGDVRAWRKRLLAVYTGIAIASTLALGITTEGMILWAMVFITLGNASYEGTNAFYASLLPWVTTTDRMGRVSGYGWATGYLGGLICLGIALQFALQGRMQIVIFIVAAWFAIFSIPLFLFVREGPPQPTTAPPVRQVLGQLREGLSLLRRHRDLLLFFVAYFIYNDAIVTTFAFAAPFATDELAFSNAHIIGLIMGIQVAGALGAFSLGHLADRIGSARTVLLTLALMFFASIAAWWCAWQAQTLFALSGDASTILETENEVALARLRYLQSVFAAIGVGFGLCMGAAQAASRSFLASTVPADRTGEFFGFYGLVGRFSAVIGPLLFGGLSWWTGSKLWSVASLGVMFLVGFLLLLMVNEERLRRELRGDPTTS